MTIRHPLTHSDRAAVQAGLEGYAAYLARQGKSITDSQWLRRTAPAFAQEHIPLDVTELPTPEQGDAWEPPA